MGRKLWDESTDGIGATSGLSRWAIEKQSSSPILAASPQFHNHTRTPSEYWRHSRVRVEAGRFPMLAERLPVPRRNVPGAWPSIEFA